MEQLIHCIIKEHWPSLLQMAKGRAEGMAEAVSSLVKAAMLDMDFAISVYMEALDGLRKKAEEAGQEAIRLERALVANSVGVGLAKLTLKDLTYRMSGDIP
jgi:methyl-accepting chemotaxis protein